MTIKSLIWIIIFLFFTFHITQSQVIKSEKTTIRLGKDINKKITEGLDSIPPEVIIIVPNIEEGTKYISKDPEINLIGKAIDQNSINSVIVNDEVKEISATGIFTARLILKPGENVISVIAMDSENNYLENKIIIEYVPEKLTLADKVNKESEYYALLIGIKNYEYLNSLDYPLQDAEELYNILISKYLFKKENVRFIKDARRVDIINALDDLAQKMSPADNLLIFYAGHGWWDEDANIGYWLPSDAKRNSKAAWFRNSTIVDYLKEIESKHTLLITDACFGGSIFKSRTAFTEAPKAIEKLYELPSRKAMTSGTITEVPDRSSFIRFLLNRLSNNSEKYLSAEQLFSSLRIPVINNSNVVPQYGEIKNVGDEGGDFIFIRK